MNLCFISIFSFYKKFDMYLGLCQITITHVIKLLFTQVETDSNFHIICRFILIELCVAYHRVFYLFPISNLLNLRIITLILMSNNSKLPCLSVATGFPPLFSSFCFSLFHNRWYVSQNGGSLFSLFLVFHYAKVI